MTRKAEQELHQLSRLLARIEQRFPLSQGELGALRKAGIALALVFFHDLKTRLDTHYKSLGKRLTRGEKEFLSEIGLNQYAD
jgi:hypothetical protein